MKGLDGVFVSFLQFLVFLCIIFCEGVIALFAVNSDHGGGSREAVFLRFCIIHACLRWMSVWTELSAEQALIIYRMGCLKAHLCIVIYSDAFLNLLHKRASLSMNYLADRDFVFSVNGSRVILQDANNDYINASYVDVS